MTTAPAEQQGEIEATRIVDWRYETPTQTTKRPASRPHAGGVAGVKRGVLAFTP